MEGDEWERNKRKLLNSVCDGYYSRSNCFCPNCSIRIDAPGEIGRTGIRPTVRNVSAPLPTSPAIHFHATIELTAFWQRAKSTTRYKTCGHVFGKKGWLGKAVLRFYQSRRYTVRIDIKCRIWYIKVFAWEAYENIRNSVCEPPLSISLCHVPSFHLTSNAIRIALFLNDFSQIHIFTDINY